MSAIEPASRGPRCSTGSAATPRSGPRSPPRCRSGSSPRCCSSPTCCCWSTRSGGSRAGSITHELTLENYRRLFGTDLYPSTILFSAGIAIRVTLFSLLLAYPLAYLLAFKVKRHKQLMYMAVIIPLWVSYLVRAYAWKIILGQSGILNGLLAVGRR